MSKDDEKAAMSAEAETLLEAIKQLQSKAEEAFKSIEITRTKADSDALLAHNAKLACEGHSTTIAGIKGTVEADVSAISANKTKTDEFLATITTTKASIEAANTAVDELKAEIHSTLTSANTSEEGITAIIDRLKQSEGRSKEFEVELLAITETAKTLADRVDKLLPGAASAGLASAFNSQKGRFKLPRILWIVTFVLCMAGLVGISIPSFAAAVSGHSPSSWDEIFRAFLMRLPIAIPLIWMAVYSGRNHMLSLKVEEDYAFKEAVSSAFEGYKREMQGIAAANPTEANPLTTLCINVLSAIAERPGRIYDGKMVDISPINEAKEEIERARSLSAKKIPKA